ncbi:MAG: PadR family transcriptional regulator [Vicinamibacteria bacterium]
MEALTTLTYQILLALAGAPLHGYGIIKEVARRTEGEVELEAGTLYAAIKRIRDEGLIDLAPAPRGERGDSRRRYYRLTPLGRRAARRESERLLSLVELAREKKMLPQESAS